MSRYKVLYRILFEIGPVFSEPNQARPLPPVVIVVTGPPRDAYIAENIVIRPMTMIAIEPVTLLLGIRNSEDLINVSTRVEVAYEIHRRCCLVRSVTHFFPRVQS